MKLKHITINVTDIDRSIEFYELIPELKVIRRQQIGSVELAFLANKEGETEVELLQFPDRQFSGKGMFLCFECNKIDAMHQLAVERGLNPSPVQTPDDGTRYFYVYDPDGVSIQLRSFD
ncbi:MAG: VOC family protein [Fastidiosipilaceae bacterium]|jgi:lactoylglutathione lyase|nr:VOC family protein [Clostridiaceae bacterium]